VTSPISYAAAEGYWIAAGGPADQAATAAAIAEAESSLIPDNTQQGQPYATTGWGLWQITPGDSEPQYGTDSALNDPLTNAKAAVAKYKSAGNNFSPWTTYEDGAYKRYLNTSTTPDTTASGSSSTAGGSNINASDCLISAPSIDLYVTSLGGGCIVPMSWGRALLGGALIAASGLITLATLAMLVSSMKNGNTGVKHAAGSVSGLFAHPAQTAQSASQSPEGALTQSSPVPVPEPGPEPAPAAPRRKAVGRSKSGKSSPLSVGVLAQDFSLDDALALAAV
jgi:hypothetical protein